MSKERGAVPAVVLLWIVAKVGRGKLSPKLFAWWSMWRLNVTRSTNISSVFFRVETWSLSKSSTSKINLRVTRFPMVELRRGVGRFIMIEISTVWRYVHISRFEMTKITTVHTHGPTSVTAASIRFPECISITSREKLTVMRPKVVAHFTWRSVLVVRWTLVLPYGGTPGASVVYAGIVRQSCKRWSLV